MVTFMVTGGRSWSFQTLNLEDTTREITCLYLYNFVYC